MSAAVSTQRIQAQTPTVVMNDQDIIQPVTRRIGLNIGSINYYDNGQVLKNLIGSINPGFEPLIDSQIWVVQTAGTTTTFQDPDQYDGQPANYWAGGTFSVVASQSGGAEQGCTGAIVSNTGPNYPEAGRTTYTNPVFTTSACPGPYSVGDIVILSKTTSPTPETWWEASEGGPWASITGGGKLLSDTTDLCATCGSQALELNATTAGSTAGILSYFDTAPDVDIFVLMNGAYQISFWAKSASGSPTLAVTAERQSAGGFNCGNQTQALTATWTLYTLQCYASETAKTTTPGNAYVSVIASGGAAYLDNLSFQKTGTNTTNTTVFRDEVFTTLQNFYNLQSGGDHAILRDWLGQNGENYDNWTAPSYAHKPTSSGGGYFVGPGGSGVVQLSIADYLNLCKALGVEPSLEVPVTISTQDASSLIEFLAGPVSSAGGARRAALGETEPWTSSFDTILLSFCNECWNGSSFVGQSLPARSGTPNSEYYYDYSVRSKSIFAAMRSNPYFTESAFDLVMNAQTAVNYSMDAAVQRANPDSIQIENYSYATVNSFATDALLWTPDVAELVSQQIDPTDPTNYYQSLNDYENLTACGPGGVNVCNVTLYEWGSGTQAGSIDQTHLDYISAGAGTGIISALSPLLTLQTHHVSAQAYFSLTEFQNTALNGEIGKVWGITVDMGGATNNVRPQYLAMSLVNQSIIGPMYSCTISNNPTFNFAGSPTNGASVPPGVPANAVEPYLFSFCFESSTNRSMVLVNADLVASHTVNFSGTNTPTGPVTQRQYAPSSPDLLNEAPSGSPSNLTVAKVALTTAMLTSPTSITLPPFSVTALDFFPSGKSSGGPTATPTFTPVGGTYPTGQSVTIRDVTPGAVIYYTINGSTPTTASTVYTGQLIVNTTETVEAIAVASGDTNSSIGSAVYTINVPTTATPTFSLLSGSYTGTQTLTLSDLTAGAIIYYSTDGTVPTTASTVYSAPISVSKTETVQAIAVAPDYATSATGAATYTISATPASKPTFSPVAGNYATEQTVTISDGTAGAIIYFTTNGALPTTSSPVYTGPFPVSATETVQAIAAATGLATSGASSALYTIGAGAAATPTFKPSAGTYGTAQVVTIGDTTAGSTIYYTTNGSIPSTTSAVYSVPITVGTTENLIAFAVATGYTNSPTGSAAYTINLSAAVALPSFSPGTGTYSTAQTVTIADATAGATIYYTTNGSTPTTASPVYTSPIKVSTTETINAIAAKTGVTTSAETSATYTITSRTAATPLFSPAAGTYTTSQSVSISDATAGTTIYYTTNGTTPTSASTPYSAPVTVGSTETLNAIAVATGYTTSAVGTAAYTISATAAATPTFSLSAGSYIGPQTVSIQDATAGTAIYYTTNGTVPTSASTEYTSPISVVTSETLQAIASKTGYNTSAVASASYTIGTAVVATPVFSPVSGTYPAPLVVSITTSTPGATIFYSVNGVGSNATPIQYTGPVTITGATTFYSGALKAGYSTSAVALATYKIGTPVVATPVISPASGTYAGPVTVTITDATPGSTIYYSVTGTSSGGTAILYTGPVTIRSSTNFYTGAVEQGYTTSAVSSAQYTVSAGNQSANRNSTPSSINPANISDERLRAWAKGLQIPTVVPKLPGTLD